MLADAALLEKLAAAWPAARWRNVTVLMAVSGGADSVALARGLRELHGGGEGRLVLAHFNHRLRGAESNADQAFVGELAEQLGLQLIVGSATSDLAAAGSGEGVEGAARQARYDFLERAAAQCGARYVATAHTADDQVETVLHNVVRGTGLAGLAGIPRVRRLSDATTIVRPLLDVTRAEVIDYLQSLGQAYRDDSTNRLEDYTRNRIRLQLLPLLAHDYNPRVHEALLRLAQIAGQADELLNREAERLLRSATRQLPDGIELNLARMAEAPPSVVRQTLLQVWQQHGWPLQDMSYEKWSWLGELLQRSAAGDRKEQTQMLPGGVRAQVHADNLRLTGPKPPG